MKFTVKPANDSVVVSPEQFATAQATLQWMHDQWDMENPYAVVYEDHIAYPGLMEAIVNKVNPGKGTWMDRVMDLPEEYVAKRRKDLDKSL